MLRSACLAALVAASAPAAGAALPPADLAPADVAESPEAAARCLAAAVSYEAGNEPLDGQQAVAQVVLNRLHHRAFPKTVCGVVYQGSERVTGCQFTFTCDGSLRRPRTARSWAAALAVAQAALAGLTPDRVGDATHYHADYVMPRWAPALVRVGAIGRHIFYRFPGQDAGAAAVAPAGASAAAFAPWGLSVPLPAR